jgi:uncharacterized protein (TIRG00374 family)
LKGLISNWKQGLQVSLSLLVAIWIFYVLYKDLSWAELTDALKKISLPWILASIAISIVGNWLRAWRWKLLLQASDKQGSEVTTLSAFFALMFGYLINFIIPRAGEIARCAFLNKKHQLPMGTVIGTVILERTIDFMFFLTIIFLAFILENQMFLQLSGNLITWEGLVGKMLGILPQLSLAIILLIGIFWLIRKRIKSSSSNKILAFFASLKIGLKSIFALKNPFGFLGSSIAIWIIYYYTLVFVAWSFPSTDSLSLGSLFVVMVMGSIGMIAPVQGGIGTFHALVAYILTVYGISEFDGKIFAIILHGSQMLTLIGLGLVSLVVLIKITSSLKQKTV